jgi:hypothetical protein
VKQDSASATLQQRAAGSATRALRQQQNIALDPEPEHTEQLTITK